MLLNNIDSNTIFCGGLLKSFDCTVYLAHIDLGGSHIFYLMPHKEIKAMVFDVGRAQHSIFQTQI